LPTSARRHADATPTLHADDHAPQVRFGSATRMHPNLSLLTSPLAHPSHTHPSSPSSSSTNIHASQKPSVAGQEHLTINPQTPAPPFPPPLHSLLLRANAATARAIFAPAVAAGAGCGRQRGCCSGDDDSRKNSSGTSVDAPAPPRQQQQRLVLFNGDPQPCRFEASGGSIDSSSIANALPPWSPIRERR
jgi:hypothetical protein